MKIKSLLFGALVLVTTTSAQVKPDMLDFNSDEKKQISVNNRILAKVNGNAISVVDVMKKMDMIFYKEFPEYTSIKAARLQFYLVNWKSILQELINKELVLADAEEIKLQVSNGEVRKEMETLFGPNIIANLDKINMSMDEAWKIVKGDITIRRMMLHRVNAKALRQIGPKEIRTAYELYSKENVKSDEWHYRVISVRDKDPEKGSAIAVQIEALIQENPSSFEELAEKIRALSEVPKSSSINISEEFVHNDLQLSPIYKEILSTLQLKSYTPPLSQKSRADKTTVYRIFYLKDKIQGGPPNFNAIEMELKDKLLQEAIAIETDLYLKKLRAHFAVNESLLKEMVPEDFQPFAMH